jgi:cytochrome P450
MAVTQSERTLSNFLAYLDGLRERGAVHYDGQRGAWHVLGYHDALQVLNDPATFSSEVPSLAPKPEGNDLFAIGNPLRSDDPAHRRLRGLVSQAFTPKMIADLEPRVVEVAGRLLDEADAGGERWDLIEQLGFPLPFIAIAEMLGIPVTDRAFLRRLSDAFLEARNVDPKDPQGGSPVMRIAPVMHELNAHLLEVVRARRKNPGDDLTSRLMAVEADGMRLDDDETIGMIGLLLGGYVTTTSTMGNTMLSLEENPHVWEQLRADPELIPALIEESARYRPPFPRVGRRATKDTEIAGQQIPAESVVLVWLTAANRDESVFADPDRFDIHRKPNAHIAFGKGIHFCLGAPLARLLIKVEIRLLMQRYREIRVCDDVPVDLRNPWVMMGVNHLPIQVRRH